MKGVEGSAGAAISADCTVGAGGGGSRVCCARGVLLSRAAAAPLRMASPPAGRAKRRSSPRREGVRRGALLAAKVQVAEPPSKHSLSCAGGTRRGGRQ